MSSSSSSTGGLPPLPTDAASLQRIAQWRRRKLPAPPLSRLLAPWFLVHGAAVACYLVAREVLARVPASDARLPPFEWSVGSSKRETQMFLILGVIMLTKFRRCNTIETWLTQAMRFAQLAVVCAAYCVDLRLSGAFFLLYAVLLLAGPALPHYRGPSHVRDIGLNEFQQSIDSKQHTQAKSHPPAETFLVQLYSSRVESCVCFESEYARASLHFGYAGSRVQFTRISVDAHPSLLTQFQVVTPNESRHAHELPTILMFCEGKLLARLPQPANNALLNESNMVRAFDLDHRALAPAEAWATKQAAASSKKAR